MDLNMYLVGSNVFGVVAPMLRISVQCPHVGLDSIPLGMVSPCS